MTAEHLDSIRDALKDMRSADDCTDYKVLIRQDWPDAGVTFAFPLPHWLVLAGLEAMERELVAQMAGVGA